MTMLAPSLASACAMPRPMPDVEPVTTAVLPLRVMANLLCDLARELWRILPQSSALEYARFEPILHGSIGDRRTARMQ